MSQRGVIRRRVCVCVGTTHDGTLHCIEVDTRSGNGTTPCATQLIIATSPRTQSPVLTFQAIFVFAGFITRPGTAVRTLKDFPEIAPHADQFCSEKITSELNKNFSNAISLEIWH